MSPFTLFTTAPLNHVTGLRDLVMNIGIDHSDTVVEEPSRTYVRPISLSQDFSLSASLDLNFTPIFVIADGTEFDVCILPLAFFDF
jgi:hypothetical protein